MKTFKIKFADGNEIVTSLNTDLKGAKEYYLGKAFQFGDTEECPHDKLVKAVSVDEIYEGWTNSRTWNAAWLLEQDQPSYETISAIRKAGDKVLASRVKATFQARKLKLESWTIGAIDWQEIADNYNEQEY